MKGELRWVRARIVAIALVLMVAGGGVAAAAPCVFEPCPSPTPSPTSAPSPTPPPSPEPTPTPTRSPVVPPPTQPGVTPAPSASAKPSASPTGSPDTAKENSALPPGLQQPASFNIPLLARTAPRNTYKLIQLLQPLTKYGFSLQQVLLQGMGRFPVAGIAFWSDDWLAPRSGPPPHLHEGLDIFADFGTPIRSPDDGVITRLGEEASDRLGGVNVYVRGSDGTEYYFAHLLAVAEGMSVGKSVKVGTVIGFVGDTGNARGGAPHLHFEVHKPGPVAPKPIVDKWLEDAENNATSWVKLETEALRSRKHAISGPPGARDTRPTSDLDTTMLLTLLDPVAGSVGFLPRLELQPPSIPVSTLVWKQLIELRLDGHLLVPGRQSAVQGD